MHADGTTSGLVEYVASGIATGPYSGSFEERGIVTIQNNELTDFHATFTIFSTELITGSKSLSSLNAPGSSHADCSFIGGVERASVTAFVSYDAQIGAAADSGEAILDFFVVRSGATYIFRSFLEMFYLSTTVVSTPGKITGAV